jgi:O-antigen ligase
MRITLAVLALAVAAGISTLAGTGPLYPEMLALTCIYLVLASLERPIVGKAVACILWGSVFVAAVAVAQVPFIPRPPSIFRSPNYLGAFAAIMLFLAWQGRHRTAIIANAASLCLAQSRGALLAAGAGCCVMLWRHSRVAAILAPCIAGVAVLAIRSGSEQHRLDLWWLGWQAFLQRPVTGWGPGGLGVWPGLNQFHSVPLDLAIGGGVIGLAGGAWLFIEAWVGSRRATMNSRCGHNSRNAASKCSGMTSTGMRPFLAAWLVQGLFLSAHPATMIPFFAALALVSGRVQIPGDEADPAAVVDHREPLADRGAGALRP